MAWTSWHPVLVWSLAWGIAKADCFEPCLGNTRRS